MRMGYVPPEDDVYEVEEGVEAKPLEELQYMDFTTDGYWGDEMSGQVEKDEEMPADVTERRRRSQNLPKKNQSSSLKKEFLFSKKDVSPKNMQMHIFRFTAMNIRKQMKLFALPKRILKILPKFRGLLTRINLWRLSICIP